MRSIGLEDIPSRLVPTDPRMGAGSVPVPPSRVQALESSGSALLGRESTSAEVEKFRAEVIDELRELLKLGEGYECGFIGVTPQALHRALALETWGRGLSVQSSGPASDKWREAASGPPRALLELLGHSAGPVQAVGVVAREAPAWREVGNARNTWCVADLSHMGSVLCAPNFTNIDLGFFCPSMIFAVPTGCTVVVASARAAALARRRHAEMEALANYIPTLHGLLSDPRSVSACCWQMFGRSVRLRLETDVAHLEEEVQTRATLVENWAASRSWASCTPRQAGGPLALPIRTTLNPDLIARVTQFLEDNQLVYGILDEDHPSALRIGLHDSVPVTDFERLLGLVDFLVERMR